MHLSALAAEAPTNPTQAPLTPTSQKTTTQPSTSISTTTTHIPAIDLPAVPYQDS